MSGPLVVAAGLVVIDAAHLERRLENVVERVLARARSSQPSEWLDAKAVGALFGIHARSVRKLRGLPSHKFGEKLLRYRRDEVLAWANDQGRKVCR